MRIRNELPMATLFFIHPPKYPGLCSGVFCFGQSGRQISGILGVSPKPSGILTDEDGADEDDTDCVGADEA